MVYADFDFYQKEYYGIVITESSEYTYFSERAGDELAPFAARIPSADDAQTALKRCSCRIADILYGDFKNSKNGVARVGSESVSGGYYSVSYVAPTDKQIRRQINNAIVLYLGKYIIGGTKYIII